MPEDDEIVLCLFVDARLDPPGDVRFTDESGVTRIEKSPHAQSHATLFASEVEKFRGGRDALIELRWQQAEADLAAFAAQQGSRIVWQERQPIIETTWGMMTACDDEGED